MYLQPSRPVAEIGKVGIPVKAWQTRVRMERTRLINQIQLYAQYQQYLGVDLSAQQAAIAGSAEQQRLARPDRDRPDGRRRNHSSGVGHAGHCLPPPRTLEQSIQAAFQFYPLGTPTATISPTSVAPPTLSPETLALVTITPTATLFPTPTLAQPSTETVAAGSPTALAPCLRELPRKVRPLRPSQPQPP